MSLALTKSQELGDEDKIFGNMTDEKPKVTEEEALSSPEQAGDRHSQASHAEERPVFEQVEGGPQFRSLSV